VAKKFWRCSVCGDVHYGLKGPEICPTCKAKNAFVEITEKEAKKVLFDETIDGPVFQKDDLLRVWGEFSKDNDLKLNPETQIVDTVVEGVLANEKQYGLKLCPCRLRDGSRARDIALICPCNFKTHETWKTQDRCWCGLFVKR